MKNGGVKIKKQKLFPYYEMYKEKFPINNQTIFVYNDTIFTDIPKEEIYYDVIYHELRHIYQQKEMGADIWILRYLEDPKFRLEMELDAYRYQLKKVLEETGDKQEVFNILTECQKNLSSELYGNIVTYKKAGELLKI